MNNSALITQIKYNNWANGRLIQAAEGTPPEQLNAHAQLSKGSAFETIRHMVDVEWSWRLACEGLPATQLLWEIEPLPDLPAVKYYWSEEGQRLLTFVQSLSDADLEREIVPSWQEGRYQIKNVIAHILYHAAIHRGEVGSYLGRLGYSPGDLDFLDYISSEELR